MRKALFVGINHYMRARCLNGCVKDAICMYKSLSVNADGTPNFEGRLLLSEDEETMVTQHALRSAVDQLFAGNPDVALLYFSGHGSIDKYGTYLCTSDTAYPREAVSLREIMDIAELSQAKHKIIILDCCHSGGAGSSQKNANISTLPNNTIILAASRDQESSVEINGQGLFTYLLLLALEGGATDILGDITPASVYSYIEKSLGAWEQRPVFKTNIDQIICLKKHRPKIDPYYLRQIPRLFKDPNEPLQLDPRYEEDKRDVEDKTQYPEHEADFAILRKLNSLNLVVPVGEEYMYWAAVNSKACKLTPLGIYYWTLLDKQRI